MTGCDVTCGSAVVGGDWRLTGSGSLFERAVETASVVAGVTTFAADDITTLTSLSSAVIG